MSNPAEVYRDLIEAQGLLIAGLREEIDVLRRILTLYQEQKDNVDALKAQLAELVGDVNRLEYRLMEDR